MTPDLVAPRWRTLQPMSDDTIDPRRRSFLMPLSRRVPPDGQPAPQVPQVGPGCLAQNRVECRLCGEACDAGAIRFPPPLGGVAAPVVDTTRCTGCGDCLPLCPPQALRLA